MNLSAVGAIVVLVAAVGFCSGAGDAPPSAPPEMGCLPLNDERPFTDSAGSAALGARAHALQCHDEGKFGSAVAEWKKAIALRAGEPQDGLFDLIFVHAALGVDYDLDHETADGRTEWTKAMSLRARATIADPVTPMPSGAISLFEERRFREAFVAFDRAGYGINRATYGDEGSLALFDQANRAAKAGAYANSAQLLHQALAKSPSLFAGHFLLACVSFATGDRRQAIGEWEQTLLTLQTDPQDAAPGYYPAHWSALTFLLKYR